MTDSLDVLSSATGLTRAAMVEIAAKAKENGAKLRACPWHDFEPVPGTRQVFGQPERYRCRHCQGEVDRHAFYWHEQGRRHKPSQ